MPLSAINATCHPDRKHCARGLCNSCYVMSRKGVGGRALPPKGPRRGTPVTCHPGRKHKCHGMCDSCYVMWRRANLPSGKKFDWYESSGRKYHRDRHFRKQFGITADERDAMAASQGGKCALCARPDGTGKRGALHVDHCHKTGRIRGLLCARCNQAIGLLGDDVERIRRAAEYLVAC